MQAMFDLGHFGELVCLLPEMRLIRSVYRH
jgi:hypothetical protein